MTAIPVNQVLTKAEEMLDQLEKSWPKTFNSCVEQAREKGWDQFYIFSVTKKDLRLLPPTYTIYHQIRKSKPQAMPGTILRYVDCVKGTAETIWALPHEEGIGLFEKGKLFENKAVQDYIDKYLKEVPKEEKND